MYSFICCYKKEVVEEVFRAFAELKVAIQHENKPRNILKSPEFKDLHQVTTKIYMIQNGPFQRHLYYITGL